MTVPKGKKMTLPKRKLPRLNGFDYSSENYYFVTICTKDKKCIFGDPDHLNEFGRLAEKELQGISAHYDGIEVEKYVIMPNHIHAVIVIGCDGAERSRPFPTLSTVVGQYKSGVARKIHARCPELEVWQKSFYDSIIRNDNAHMEIWKYIDENQIKWQLDGLFVP